jgi:hypothetical protein
MDGTAKTVTSQANGRYSFAVSYNWSGTVTPSKSGTVFTPTRRTYTNVTTNKAAQNYTAIPTTAGSFRSAAAQDGWVLETSENSNQGGTLDATSATFILGDNAVKQQYRSILSFNTAGLPDNAVITRVTLKIKKHSLVGTDPFTTHGRIAVDIREGAFSNSTTLQPADFQALASRNAVGLISNNPAAGGWYIVRLNSAAHPFVNLVGITQLRLRFQRDDDNDAVADFIRFFSGNATPASRPVLVVEYYVQ